MPTSYKLIMFFSKGVLQAEIEINSRLEIVTSPSERNGYPRDYGHRFYIKISTNPRIKNILAEEIHVTIIINFTADIRDKFQHHVETMI